MPLSFFLRSQSCLINFEATHRWMMQLQIYSQNSHKLLISHALKGTKLIQELRRLRSIVINKLKNVYIILYGLRLIVYIMFNFYVYIYICVLNNVDYICVIYIIHVTVLTTSERKNDVPVNSSIWVASTTLKQLYNL